MALDNEQRAIARSAIVALVVTVSLVAATGVLSIMEGESIEERLSLLAISLSPLAVALLRDIARLANHRCAEPLD